MPCTEGTVPVPIEACPAQVTVFVERIRGVPEAGAGAERGEAMQAARPVAAVVVM